jgi:hypothetical protein
MKDGYKRGPVDTAAIKRLAINGELWPFTECDEVLWCSRDRGGQE